MRKQFTLGKVAKMGGYDEKYGQAFWAEAMEQLDPLKFNLMQGEPKAGDTITCEEVLLKTSAKGIDYHQLKKVRIVAGNETAPTPDSPQSPQRSSSAGQPISESKIEQILELVRENNQMLKQLTGPRPFLVNPNSLDDPIFDESGAPIREDY